MSRCAAPGHENSASEELCGSGDPHDSGPGGRRYSVRAYFQGSLVHPGHLSDNIMDSVLFWCGRLLARAVVSHEEWQKRSSICRPPHIHTHSRAAILRFFEPRVAAGAMCRFVEQIYEDKLAVIFSQGASGDQNPRYLRPSTNGMASRLGGSVSGNVLVRESVEALLSDGAVQVRPMDAEVGDRLERWMESEGLILGEEVIRVITESTRTEQKVRIWRSQVEVSCPGRKRTDHGRERVTASYVDGPSVPLRLGVLGIGNVALTSVNAEIYTLISRRLKHQSPMANTVLVTLASGAAPSGYIPDDASFSHNTFQVLSSRLKPGCTEDAIANGLTDLIVRYSQQPQ